MAKEKTKFIVPERVDVESQLEKALKRADVKKALAQYDGDPRNFREGLRISIGRNNEEFSRLRRFASVLDGANRATMPIDGALDYFNIALGVGYAARGIKDLAMAPGYLAYDAYYTAKTGDALHGLLINPAYEVLSWVSLGSLPHLLRHYTKQVDKKAIENGSKMFLNKLSSKDLEGPEVLFKIGGEKRRKAA